MTERLYYDNPYLTEFTAEVLEAAQKDGVFHVRLNRSAFYPTSGGQPFDTGALGGAKVTDVYVDDAGEVWHVVNAALSVGSTVSGTIDWLRRRDHMQQHAGEHLLAGELHRRFGAYTIGLHVGSDFSTIDCEMEKRPTDAEIAELERAVNLHIQNNDPIRQWFPGEDELPSVPFRKSPSVTEHVRAVMMGDYECCACGGTHPASTAEIGLFKIIDVRPSRGKVRFAFLCGMRAVVNYGKMFDAAHGAAEILSTSTDELISSVAALKSSLQDANREAGRLKREIALLDAPKMLENAKALPDGTKVAHGFLTCDVSALRDVANAIISAGNAVALLGTDEDAPKYVFARSADGQADMGKLLSQAAKTTGGKGGGRPEFAQGGGSRELIGEALKILGLA